MGQREVNIYTEQSGNRSSELDMLTQNRIHFNNSVIFETTVDVSDDLLRVRGMFS